MYWLGVNSSLVLNIWKNEKWGRRLLMLCLGSVVQNGE